MSRRAPRPHARTTRAARRRVTRRLARRRSVVSLLLVAALVAGTVAAFGRDLIADLVAGAVPGPEETTRPLSEAEAARLAGMWRRNWNDGQAAVRATIRHGAERAQVVGWVDWRRPLVYLRVASRSPGTVPELVQGTPGLIATRPAPDPGGADPSAAAGDGTTPAAVPFPAPPADPPPDGWQMRRSGGLGPPGAATAPGTVDTLVALLFMIGGDRPDTPDLLAGSGAQWLGRDHVGEYAVDVLLGPATPPAPAGAAQPVSLADLGGAVRYWLDDRAGLHRLEALLAADTPVRVDLDRTDRTPVRALDVFGGDPVAPRSLTAEEVRLLSGLPAANRAAGGGQVSLTVPLDGATVRASGWLDWRNTLAYLIRTAAGGETDLMLAGSTGIETRPDRPADSGLPPLPRPAGAGWHHTAWEEHGDELGGFDLELLLNEALALGGPEPIDTGLLQVRARWLRSDRVGEEPVEVFELPRTFEHEAGVAAGQARMRYWVNHQGVLRRLEIRTRTGGFGQLDLIPAPVPALG